MKKIHLAKLLTITCAALSIFVFSPISTSCSRIKKPVSSEPELKFIPEHEGDHDLSKEDDVTKYDIEIENGSFSDYTGTECHCDDYDFLTNDRSEDYDGYVSRHTPADPSTDSFLFLNDNEDISQGAYVQMHLLKNYVENDMYYDFHTTVRIIFHDDRNIKPDLVGYIQFTFYNSTDNYKYVSSTDTLTDFTTSNVSNITSSSTLADMVTTMESANGNATGTVPYSDEWVSKHIDAKQLATLYLIERRNVLAYTLSTYPGHDFDITVEIHRTSPVGVDDVKHTFNISLSQYVYDSSSNLYNIFWYRYNIPHSAILPSASFSAMDATFEGLSLGPDGNASTFAHLQSPQKWSQNLINQEDTLNVISGNLNQLYSAWPKKPTGITYQNICNAFWPNVTFTWPS